MILSKSKNLFQFDKISLSSSAGGFPYYIVPRTKDVTDVLSADHPLYMQTIEYNISKSY